GQFLAQALVDALQQLVAHHQEHRRRERRQGHGHDAAVPQRQLPADVQPPHQRSLSAYPTPRTVWISCRRPGCSTFLRRALMVTSITFVSTPSGSFHTSRAIMSRVTVALWCSNRYSSSSNSRLLRTSCTPPRTTRWATRSISRSSARSTRSRSARLRRSRGRSRATSSANANGLARQAGAP